MADYSIGGSRTFSTVFGNLQAARVLLSYGDQNTKIYDGSLSVINGIFDNISLFNDKGAIAYRSVHGFIEKEATGIVDLAPYSSQYRIGLQIVLINNYTAYYPIYGIRVLLYNPSDNTIISTALSALPSSYQNNMSYDSNWNIYPSVSGDELYICCYCDYGDNQLKLGFGFYGNPWSEYNPLPADYALQVQADIGTYTIHIPFGIAGGVPLWGLEYTNLKQQPTTSGVGGGGGTFDTSSDVIGDYGLPSINISATGICTMLNPTIEEVQQLNQWLFDDSILTTLSRHWNNPLDLIIHFGIIPFAIPSAQLGSKINVKFGGNAVKINDTPVQMSEITNTWVAYDCGTISVQEFFGSSLDYGRNTKISIYVPFCGTHEIDINEIMGSTITLKYKIDIFSGFVIANLFVKRGNLDALLYTYNGNFKYSLPLTSIDYTNAFKQIASGITSMATAGIGNVTGIADSALSIMSAQPTVNHGSSLNGNDGILMYPYPYLIMHRPIQSLPDNFGRYKGYPSNITKRLGDLTGFTKVYEILTNNISAMDEEIEEIINLLKEGVIL